MSHPLDLSDVPVVDGHCHPLYPNPWDVSPEAVTAILTEARPGTLDAHVPHTSLYRRTVRALARWLGVEATLEAVLAGRRARGSGWVREAVAERRVVALLVDTGYPPEAMPLDAMAALLPCAVHEVVRIERVAERLLSEGHPLDDFLVAYRAALEAALPQAVAFKSIVAYRSGLAVQPWDLREVAVAYERARDRVRAGAAPRLVERPLLDHLLLTALEVAGAAGRPLQLHAGFGDPDLDLPRANPLLLRPLLEDSRWRQARLVLLHLAYPYAREAAFMAAVWPQVFVDLSLALPHLGPGALPLLGEVLALAPATKLLYGSDLRGLPELFALAADWARELLGDALAGLVARDALDPDEALAVARGILATNARDLYRLSSAG